MRDDSDILGNPLRPDPALVSSSSSSSSSSGSSFFFYVFLLAGTVLVFRYYSQIQAFFQTDPELAHRRRLGIPDHDKRPLEAAKPRTRPPPVKQPVRLEQQLERERTLATPRRDQVHVQFASPPVIQRPPRQPEQPPAQKTQHFVEPRQPVSTTQSEPALTSRNEKRARDEEGPVDKRARARVEPTEVIKEEMPMEVDARVVQTRGTKRERDRAEEEGSVVGEGDENSTKEKKRQRRKSKRMSDMGPPPEVHPRGVKRGVEDDASVIGDDSDIGETKKSKKKKKGRQSRSSTYDGDREDDYALYDRGRLPFPETDIDMEEPDIAVSTNPNKEWEVNGVRYRINSDGQRVRFSFVKKQTRRYPMPADAIHPDAKSVVKLCVERWLTDAEYAAHKQQGLLAWESSYENDDMDDIVQGQSSRAPGKQNQLSIATGTPTRGKTLLYGSPSAPSSPALSRRESITSVGSATSTPARRSRLSGMGTTPRNSMIRYAAEKLLEDSTNRTDDGKDAKEKRGDDARIVSKWEKQDLEAEGMKALRERKGTPKKVATPNLSTTMPSSGASSLLLTKPTLATSTSAPAVSASNPLFPLGTPSAPSSAPTAAPAASPASTPSKPTPSGLGLGLPTSMAPPQAAPPPGLSFNKPAATPVQSQPKPPVSLFPSAPPTDPAPAVSAPAPGSFTFPKLPTSTTAAPLSTAPTPAANNGGNLFTRVGPPAAQPQPQAQSKNEQPKTQFTSLFPPPAPASAQQLQAKPPTQPSTLFPPAPPASQKKDAQPLFSFQAAMAKPNTPAATSAPPAAPSTESDKAKWSFNHTVQAAPAASNPFGTNTTKAPAPTTTAPANAFSATNGPGEKQPLFSFKAALTPGQQQEEKKTPTANAGMASKPLFSSGGGNLFGKPNEQKKDDAAPKNLFGTTGGGGFGTPAAMNQEKKDETPKPLFGFGTGSMSGTGGGFGQPKKDDTAAPTKPLFGTFGASTTNTADAPKPLFGSFTNLPTASAGTKTTEPSASKPTFGGLGTAAPAAEAPKPTPSFTFAAAPAAEASKPTSSFNFASTSTAAPSAPSGSLFGGQAPTNKPEEKKKEGGSGFAGFGSTTTSNGFGGASGASTPAFGTGPSTTPFGTGPSTTPFGTGASTPSPFGGGGSTSSAFGTLSAPGNGSAPSSNPAPAPTFGGFGSTSKPTFGSTPSSAPAFGAPATSSTSTETRTLFGAPSAAPGASNATSNPFGTPSSANSSAFGSGGSAFSFGGNSTAGSSTSFSFGQK